MKVLTERKKMLQSLIIGGSMAGKSKTLAILNCVKVTVKGLTMTISSYDGQNSVTKIFDIKSSEGDICFCVDCKDLTGVLRSLKDHEVLLDIDDFNIRVNHKKGVQSLPLDNADEYPIPTKDATDDGFVVDAAVLHEAVSTARSFIQSNDLRPQMASVYLSVGNGRIDIASTDGFSLFADFMPFDTYDGVTKEATINLNAISPLLDMISTASNVNIRIGERTMSFRTDDSMLTSTMSEYKYPNYKAIIPTEHTIEVNLEKDEILDTLSRVMLTANKESCLVKLSTEGMNLNVLSEDFNTSKKSKESLLCEKSGGDITIGVKGTYFKTCLEQIKSDKVSLYMTVPSRPMILKDDMFENRTIMLMPMAN